MYFATDSSIVCGQTAKSKVINDLTSVPGDDIIMNTAGNGDDDNSNSNSTNSYVAGGGSTFEIVGITGNRWDITISDIGQTPDENYVEHSTLFKDLCLCGPWNVYCQSEEARMMHVQSSDIHPMCERCDQRFVDDDDLQNHLDTSIRHNVCPECQCDFYSPEELNNHIYPSQTDTSALLDEIIDDFRTYSDINGTETEEEPPGASIYSQPDITPYWSYPTLINPVPPALAVPTIEVVPPTPLCEVDCVEIHKSWPQKIDHRYLQPPIRESKRRKRESRRRYTAIGSLMLAGVITLDGVEYIIVTDGMGNSCLIEQARLMAEYRRRIEVMEEDGLQHSIQV